MSDPPISRFDVPDLDDLPDDIRQRDPRRPGEDPASFPTCSSRSPAGPDEFRAFFAFHATLMDSDEGLSKAERELIVVATSALNHCLYCVVAHGAILRIRAKDPLIADQVAVNPAKADLTDRQRAIVDFAIRVAEDSASITDADLDDMRAKGFSDDEIWDIGAITALFALSNRYANFAGIRPNDEFYGMGALNRGRRGPE